MTKRHTDEGVIDMIEHRENGVHVVWLTNGNFYKVSRTCLQDVYDSAFMGVTVRLLLNATNRIWDISVI